MKNQKTLLSTLLLAAITFSVNAQKLPNKQVASLRAPDNIKIDGDIKEWKSFEAYNKATDIFYTICNDDNNIYLAIKSQIREITDKILRGGITFTINSTLNKKDNDYVSFSYPVLRDANAAAVTNMLAHKENDFNDGGHVAIQVIDINKLLDDKSKIINISGVKAITDEAVSVYNQEGIKAASKFDSHVNYIYELAIPIKYLNLVNNAKGIFSYHIQINEPAEMHLTPPSKGGGLAPPPPPLPTTSFSTTDFWGEYTLAKK